MTTIDKASISAVTGITAANRTYDGTTAATLDTTDASFSGIVSGDSLSIGSASGAFTDKNAGMGKIVTVTGITLGGADAGNYTLLSDAATTTADISKAALTISAHDASNGTARTHRRHHRRGIGPAVRHGCEPATGEIEHEVSHVPETVLDVVAEDPQVEHVAEQMHPAAMEEHRHQDRTRRRGKGAAPAFEHR